MNICVKCGWHKNVRCGTGPVHEVHHRCTCPKVALRGKMDPVTGKITYGFNDSAFEAPVCSAINLDGDCEYYELLAGVGAGPNGSEG